ncbi:MAG: hypothetical protein SFY69_02595 [Planctomycetota bacterium]|nr:hypothetical protein [Planctomycetota bacterium]
MTGAEESRAALVAMIEALRAAARSDAAVRAALVGLLREVLNAPPAEVSDGTSSARASIGGMAATAGTAETSARGADGGAESRDVRPGGPDRGGSGAGPLPGDAGVREGARHGPRVVHELRLGDARAEVVSKGNQVEKVVPRDSWDEPPVVSVPSRGDRMDGAGSDAPRVDLARVATRARLKSEACRLVAAGGSAAGLRDRLATMHDAGAQDDGRWMFQAVSESLRARAASAGACYDALAAAADLAGFLEKHDQLRAGNGLEHAFALIAQAQSAVKNFLDDADHEVDADQFGVFRWLRFQTGEHACRVLVHRYMRRDDVAPPEQAPLVREGIERELEAWRARVEVPKQIRIKTNKLRYELGRAADEPDAQERLRHWRTIDACVAALRELGQRERDVAAWFADVTLPEGFEPGPALAGVLACATRREQPSEAEDRRTWSSEVPRARGVLEGARLLVLCGNPNASMREDYIEAFGLAACEWPEIKDHKFPVSRVEASIRSGSVNAVLLAHGYTNHHHGEVADVCRGAGVPLIRLAANSGYGVNQVARAALEQIGPRPPHATA